MTEILISLQEAIEAIESVPEGNWKPSRYIKELEKLDPVQPKKEIPIRVRWSGRKGHRYTRYYCPNCEKPVRNDDCYCHRCGQRLTFPKVTFTDYVPGKKQQTIITWEDD
jgi:hypothetical protein